jgi:RNA polymerase sigma factor (sigma-70 family)
VDRRTEWDLISRCRRGSTAAFEPLVRAHEARALAVAEGMLGDVDDAADAVQEAFVKAYRSLRRLREGSTFGPWFRTILRNHCRDRLRSSGGRTHVAWDERVAGDAG